MADPRATVNNVGVGYMALNFLIDDSTITYSATETNGSAAVGKAVTYSDDNTIQLVGDGEAVVGKLIKVESDGVAVVQMAGVMELPGGDGATLTNGEYVFDRPSEHGRALIRLMFAPEGLRGTGTASAVTHRGKNRRTAEDCSEKLPAASSPS